MAKGLRLDIRLADWEMEILKGMSQERGLTLSAFVRSVLFEGAARVAEGAVEVSAPKQLDVMGALKAASKACDVVPSPEPRELGVYLSPPLPPGIPPPPEPDVLDDLPPLAPAEDAVGDGKDVGKFIRSMLDADPELARGVEAERVATDAEFVIGASQLEKGERVPFPSLPPVSKPQAVAWDRPKKTTFKRAKKCTSQRCENLQTPTCDACRQANAVGF